jgi:putative transposase
MPTVKVYIHFVWSTKNRAPYLNSQELRKKVWIHIKENARGKDIFIDTISGYQDHCHCLISMGRAQSMSNVMNLIKGESSFWINKNKLCDTKFEWQDEYFALSVSDSQLESVRAYIRNQEDHHAKKSFQEEYDVLMSGCKTE